MPVTSKLPGYEKSYFRDHSNRYLDAKDMESPSMPLYALQDRVDHLPVPELKDTLALYLESVQPLLTPAEMVKTKEVAEKFERTIGPVLHQRLIERAKQKNAEGTSWFSEWWNDYAYLSYRDTVVHNVSYYLQFVDESPHAMVPTRRAARFTFHALKFWKETVNGTLKPDMKKGNKPMENSQWKYLFNTCRMPNETADLVRTYAPDLFPHIVVARKNRFYKVDVVGLSIDAIEVQLNRVKRLADSLGEDRNPVGVLTSDDRDIWLRSRKVLIAADEKFNLASLEEIESAIFMICLDETAPVTREQIGLNLLHGDGKNRFWDKSFQIVFFENGKAGYIGEHSMTDGLTTTRFVNETLEKLLADSDDVKLAKGGVSAVLNDQRLEEPKLISFKINAEVVKCIVESIANFNALTSAKELKVLMFHGMGKDQIKDFQCSPDAFAQVAMQLAYYKTFNFPMATYESTQTRSFKHGRTEVTRSCTMDALNFSRYVVDAPRQTNLTPDYEKNCYGLMMKAINAHSRYIGQASQGKGCDRHLLALKFLLQTGDDDSFFKDVAYKRSGHWGVSTSGLIGEFMDGWGFGEVVPDGLGIGYSVQDSRLRFTVTSRHKWAENYIGNLEQSLLLMRHLSQTFTPQPAKSKL